MSIVSTQSFTFRLVANGTQLDVFKDEDIFISNNVTGLFDIGVLPSEFTRQITLPGTKVNNAFFEHVYDISIDNPFLFSTNVKVPAYFDFDSIYVSQGYIQLNKVNVRANKFIESYEVTMYGTLSSFSRDINRLYLTDLSSLAEYNHTASVSNISASWDRNLFNGDIVYPFADYGSGWTFQTDPLAYGLNTMGGAITVQDYKPAIRVKAVWDAIFNETGYTYTSNFFTQSWLDDVYMVCNNALKYPEFSGIELEDYGVAKWGAISGSGWTNITLNSGSVTYLPWYNVQNDPQNFIGDGSSYRIERPTKLSGEISLNLSVSSSNGNVPNMYLYFISASAGMETGSYVPLASINNFYQQIGQQAVAAGQGVNRTDTSTQVFTTPMIYPGEYYAELQYTSQYTPGGGIQVRLDPDGQAKSYIEIKKVKQAGDFRIMDIPSNMPYGTSGIKLIDFILGIQKKFNLVIYADNTKPNNFIVETFNDWYSKGQIKDFNKYINLDNNIEVIPANNFAVNKLNFGDLLDQDYVSQQFAKGANREYGKIYYTDTENFFSQGTFDVRTTFASSPLVYLAGTGVSGSVGGYTPPPASCNRYNFGPAVSSGYVNWTNCDGSAGSQYVGIGSTYTITCARTGTVTGAGTITTLTSCS